MKLKTFLKSSPFEDFTEFKLISVNGDYLTDGMTILGKSSLAPSPLEHVTEDFLLDRTVREIKAINRCELEIILAW